MGDMTPGKVASLALVQVILLAVAGCMAYDAGLVDGANAEQAKRQPLHITWYVPSAATLPPVRSGWRRAGTMTVADPGSKQFKREASALRINERVLADIKGRLEK